MRKCITEGFDSLWKEAVPESGELGLDILVSFAGLQWYEKFKGRMGGVSHHSLDFTEAAFGVMYMSYFRSRETLYSR